MIVLFDNESPDRANKQGLIDHGSAWGDHYGSVLFYGVSSDTKPPVPGDDWMFIELDTDRRYRGEGKAWVEKLNPSLLHPWTHIFIAADFATTSASAVDVTGLGFTPAANTRYEFEAQLLTRTDTTTVGPRPGLAWPTGMTDGVASIQQASSLTANVFANGNVAGPVLAPVGGLPGTALSWPAYVKGLAYAGASPSGQIRIQLASETAGTNVRIMLGSFLKYRAY